jgi:CheY-like chemotaxis protein
MKELNFPDFIGQIVRMFELQAANKGLSFRYELTGVLPRIVRADRKRLGQILINILGNAVKFTSHGGIVLRLQYAREMASFEIEDTGPGILQEEIDHIFEPFSRGSASAHADASGTGLGLPISKMLTQLMGGELKIRSPQGPPPPHQQQGSLFQIRLFLPSVHVSGKELRELEAPEQQRIGYRGPRRRVLVVDNERVDRELLLNILSPLGFEVAQAASGPECLDLYASFQPDVILMDLAMPGRPATSCGAVNCRMCRSRSSRPTPSTRAWKIRPASARRTSSSSRSTSASCWTGSANAWRWSGSRSRARKASAARCRRRRRN